MNYFNRYYGCDNLRSKSSECANWFYLFQIICPPCFNQAKRVLLFRLANVIPVHKQVHFLFSFGKFLIRISRMFYILGRYIFSEHFRPMWSEVIDVLLRWTQKIDIIGALNEDKSGLDLVTKQILGGFIITSIEPNAWTLKRSWTYLFVCTFVHERFFWIWIHSYLRDCGLEHNN